MNDRHANDHQHSLQVQGYARLTAEPDLASLDITLSVSGADYATTIIALAAKSKAVREGLHSKYVDIRKMRTGEFKIQPDTSTTPPSGYIGRCVMVLRGTLKQNWLDLVLDGLAATAPDVQVELEFGLQEPETLRQRVLVKAVAEARRNAEVLAKAAGVKLGPVTNVNYDESAHSAEISSPRIIIPLDVEIKLADFGLIPAEYGDGVRVTWELEEQS